MERKSLPGGEGRISNPGRGVRHCKCRTISTANPGPSGTATSDGKDAVFVELHIVQNFAPSCLNRDDTNTPKDCEFGGHRRARISSQCIKRAIRWHPLFKATLGQSLSLRTRRARDELAGRLVRRGLPKKDVEVALDAFIPQVLVPVSKGQTNVLLFLGHDELEKMESRLAASWGSLAAAVATVRHSAPDDEKANVAAEKRLASACADVAKGIRPGTNAADIAMFGRMIAERPRDEVDAACQVAHAISTHRVLMDMDFYTAVDDLQSADDEPGAGMMGNVEFNSSCFYRYSLVDVNQLTSNLAGDTELAGRTVEAFIRASVAAIPTGRQNSFAAQNPPAFVFVTVRASAMPWSLVNAFERPVRVGANDTQSLSEKSIQRLDDYWRHLEDGYGSEGTVYKKAFALALGESSLSNIATVRTFEELVSGAMEAVRL